MSFQELIRKETPIGWCPGCGLYGTFYAACEVIDELGSENTVVISGIGCTGRGAGYFNLDSVHGIHGRAIPLAVGVKMSNPKLDVIVFSGDGDLLGIGGNHLLHAARRNDNISVICNNNELFAMTGGQVAPTTRLGNITTTTPKGNAQEAVNAQAIILSNKKYFYARTTPVLKEHFKKCLKEAMAHNGFSFIELINPCVTNVGKSGKSPAQIFGEIKERYRITEESRPLKDDEFGIVKNG